MDLFRMRCYLASLQGGELPNPKSLLAAASRPSKLALGRLGILSVSSFHALVSARGTEDAPLSRLMALSSAGTTPSDPAGPGRALGVEGGQHPGSAAAPGTQLPAPGRRSLSVHIHICLSSVRPGRSGGQMPRGGRTG